MGGLIKRKLKTYNKELVIDVALCEAQPDKYELNEVMDLYNMTDRELDNIMGLKSFRAEVEREKQKISDDPSYVFKVMCRLSAPDIVRKTLTMINDDAVNDSVKAKLIENFVKWAGLDNSSNSSSVNANQGNFNVVIDLGSANQGKITLEGKSVGKKSEDEE